MWALTTPLVLPYCPLYVHGVYWGLLGSTGGLVRTPILSEEAYRGPRSGKPEESLDNLNAHREES